MRRSVLLASAILVVAGFSFAGDVQFTVQRLSPRVLVLTERSPMENITVAIATQKGIVVVDGLPSHLAASEARRIMEKELGRHDFAFLINTHGHWDHVFGNQAFAEATVIAQAGALNSFRRDRPRVEATATRMEERVKTLEATIAGLESGSRQAEALALQRDFNARNAAALRHGFSVREPEITFTDRLVLDLGDVTTILTFFGRAHSEGDILIQVPEEELLLTGDLFLERGWLPLFAGDGELDPPRWIDTLHDALDGEAPVKHVIPGHREVWPREKLASWRDYIVELWTGVSEAAASGATLDTTIARFPLPDRFAYLEQLDHDGAELTRFQQDNIKAFWRQLRPSLATLLERTINSEGIAAAVAFFRTEKADEKSTAYLDENEMNALGYRLLRAEKRDEAIAVLALNAETFPVSWNVHDSLGEAYMTAGKREDAIACYRRSLELNPDNANGRAILERLGAAPE